MTSCFSCLFNNKLDDKCEENLQYFYAEFGKNCPNYKAENEIKELIECDRCLGMGWGIADIKDNKVGKCYKCRGTGKIEVKNDKKII